MSKTNLEHADFDAQLDALLDEALAPEHVAPDMPADLAQRIADVTAGRLADRADAVGTHPEVVAVIGRPNMRWLPAVAAAVLAVASITMFYLGLTNERTNPTATLEDGSGSNDTRLAVAPGNTASGQLSHEAYLERELALMDTYANTQDAIDDEIDLLAMEIDMLAGGGSTQTYSWDEAGIDVSDDWNTGGSGLF